MRRNGSGARNSRPEGMTTLELIRRLRILQRTVRALETELRHGHLDQKLFNSIDEQMEAGIATAPRGEGLRTHVDALRENTLTPRPELMADTVRASQKLQDAIEGVLAELVH